MYSPESIRRAFESAIDLARMLSNAHGGARRSNTAAQDSRYSLRRLIGNSEAMVELPDQVRLYGASDPTELISRETGTGTDPCAPPAPAANLPPPPPLGPAHSLAPPAR